MLGANFEVEDFAMKEETGIIIGLGYEIHRQLGPGFLEIVYKDAFEQELQLNEMPYEREKKFEINYKGVVLNHKFHADFVVINDVILEIKAKHGGIANEDLAQTINYLKVSGCKVGLILNFAKTKLEIKRVVF
jgi:GxxExxY protein